MFSLEELFCGVDDFCKRFEPQWKQQLFGSGLRLRNRPRSLSWWSMTQALQEIAHDIPRLLHLSQ